ncbi:phosphoribosylglycinamide formyltransferase [Rhodocyclus gracilis]|uniref:Phosphoribosylglycinamide formyltransferase n=1 Tax=Rhodocyclus tenuis TaxID=1066 RepID=A0A6L5JXC7_RHOTE|nr:phosphoribosylglycinamide formyltransferase [Rhodocyclus gracilis]MQY51726.1 phosphoribosylglycinamide formyltransferase [Rhodocyclus gracilis]
MKSIVILISGRGSNLRALLDAVADPALAVRVAAVISNRPAAAGLDVARAAGVPTAVVDHREFGDRQTFDAALAECIEGFGAELVVLAGFMRILGDAFVRRFAGRLINIHPSLLPSFPGLDTHRRALDEGVRVHGCTVHFVTPALDHGPIIVQAAVPVLDGDDVELLSARVLAAEHQIYPLAVRWWAEGRLRLEDGRVRLTPPADVAPVTLISPTVV